MGTGAAGLGWAWRLAGGGSAEETRLRGTNGGMRGMQIGCRGGLERGKVKAQVGVWFNFGKASLKVRVADRRGREMRDEPKKCVDDAVGGCRGLAHFLQTRRTCTCFDDVDGVYHVLQGATLISTFISDVYTCLLFLFWKISTKWRPSSDSSLPRALPWRAPATTQPSLASRVRLPPELSTLKFGTSTNSHSPVLAWYHQHSLPVTPLNPRAPQINLPSRAYDTVPSPSKLPSPTQTSLSVVTPPPVTLQVLQEAHSVGIPAVWLQPGTFDDAVLDYAHGHFEAVIAGDGGAGGEGWCVLVDGDEGLEAAGVQWTVQRL